MSAVTKTGPSPETERPHFKSPCKRNVNISALVAAAAATVLAILAATLSALPLIGFVAAWLTIPISLCCLYFLSIATYNMAKAGDLSFGKRLTIGFQKS